LLPEQSGGVSREFLIGGPEVVDSVL